MNTILWHLIRGAGRHFRIMPLLASVLLLMTGPGGWQKDVLFGAEAASSPPLHGASARNSPEDQLTKTPTGQQLFLKNCAHCHGADAHGDEGPDLHNLDWTDEQISTRIRNGKKGQMPAFAGKLAAENLNEIIAYLRTLK